MLFVLISVFMAFPHPLRLGRATPGDYGDGFLYQWVLRWDVHSLLHAPRHLFDANIFWPHKDALAYSDTLLPAAVVAGLLSLVLGWTAHSTLPTWRHGSPLWRRCTRWPCGSPTGEGFQLNSLASGGPASSDALAVLRRLHIRYIVVRTAILSSQQPSLERPGLGFYDRETAPRVAAALPPELVKSARPIGDAYLIELRN